MSALNRFPALREEVLAMCKAWNCDIDFALEFIANNYDEYRDCDAGKEFATFDAAEVVYS